MKIKLWTIEIGIVKDGGTYKDKGDVRMQCPQCLCPVKFELTSEDEHITPTLNWKIEWKIGENDE